VLAERGRALLFFDSPVRRDSPLLGRLVRALGEDPMRVLAVAARGPAPDLQALAYAAARHPELDAGYARAVQRYREHLHRVGIESSSRVLLHLGRCRDGEVPWAAQRLVEGFEGCDAASLCRAAEAVTLAASDDEVLLAAAVRLPDGARIVEERPVGGGDSAARLRLPGTGLADQELSDAAAVLVEAVQSRSSLRDAVEAFAEAASATPSDVRDEVLGFVRRSLASGLLVPVRPSSSG